MLRDLRDQRFVLPDIQREFVWSDDQIAELFDSLMRGYPIGTFLFWKLDASTAAEAHVQFYEFITDYSELAPHNPQVTAPGAPITAVLDGQQRLSALNIGLRGSYATRTRYGRRRDPAAYPPRRLHLNLLGVNDEAAPDESKYEFEFLTDEEASATNDAAAGRFWCPARLAAEFEPSGLEWPDYLDAKGLAGNRMARSTLHRFITLVHIEPVLVAFDESDGDVDRVLNIFIRVNRGGTKLSYSDLLMSMASATWVERDARQEVHDLVDNLNAIGEGFELTRDRILKAALVLCDLPDIKLKTKTMRDHMLAVEDAWDDVSTALEVTMQLLASFGFSAASLRAGNAIIPLAYYVRFRRLTSDWTHSTRPADISDRAAIRSWVIRSLFRSGFWTGAVDPILLEARATIQHSGRERFPADELERNIEERTSKSLSFTAEQVEELLASTYRAPAVGPLLQLMFDRAAERGATHVDHVFPKTLLKKRALAKALVESERSGAELSDWLDRVDQLPNLQLLRVGENTSKGSQLPRKWLEGLTPPTRDNIVIGNDLGELPNSVSEWFEWCDMRRDRMRQILLDALGVSDSAAVAELD